MILKPTKGTVYLVLWPIRVDGLELLGIGVWASYKGRGSDLNDLKSFLSHCLSCFVAY